MANLSWKKFFGSINTWYRGEPIKKPIKERFVKWLKSTFHWGKFWVKHFCAPSTDPVTQAMRDVYMLENAKARRSSTKNKIINSALAANGNCHKKYIEQFFYQTHINKKESALNQALDELVQQIYHLNPKLRGSVKEEVYVKRAIKLYLQKRIEWEKIPTNKGKIFPHSFVDPFTELSAVIDQRPAIQGSIIPMPTWWNTIGLRAINPLSWLDLIVGNLLEDYAQFNAFVINGVLNLVSNGINFFKTNSVDIKNSFFGKLLKAIFVAPLIGTRTLTYGLAMVTSGTGGMQETYENFFSELKEIMTSHSSQVRKLREKVYSDAVENSRTARKYTLDQETVRMRDQSKLEIELSVRRRSEHYNQTKKLRHMQSTSEVNTRSVDEKNSMLPTGSTRLSASPEPNPVPELKLLISPLLNDLPLAVHIPQETPSLTSERTDSSDNHSPLTSDRTESLFTPQTTQRTLPIPILPPVESSDPTISPHQMSRSKRRNERFKRNTALPTITSQVEIDVTKLGFFSQPQPKIDIGLERKELRNILRRAGSDILRG